MNPDQLVLRRQVNLIYTVFKIRFIGVDHEICCGILLPFIFAYVKILLKFIFLVGNNATIYICCLNIATIYHCNCKQYCYNF